MLNREREIWRQSISKYLIVAQTVQDAAVMSVAAAGLIEVPQALKSRHYSRRS